MDPVKTTVSIEEDTMSKLYSYAGIGASIILIAFGTTSLAR